MKILMLFFAIVVLCSCGSARVFINNEVEFSKKNPVTINQSNDDASGTLGELQFLLKSNGYKLMSYGAAKKAINLDESVNGDLFHSEITATTEFNSVYVIDLDYKYFYGIAGMGYRRFSATVTDLRSGEIIMTAIYRGNKTVRRVLSEVVMQMNKAIK